MRNLVSTYVDQFRQDRQKQLKLAAVLAALAVLVAGLVFWQLHSTGVAMTNEVFCGQEEHIHDDGCYEQVLICGIDEEDHVHDDSCYETVLTCQIPEHTHTVACLMDETADVETADVWEATLPELTDVWPDDMVAIAESQVGYTESTSNFILADDGETHMGYTRYGAWYGNAYGDWDAMFASFCLNYANVPSGVVAENSGAYALAVSLNEQGLYIDAADFTPAAGDLVFFSESENGTVDRVGIIANVSEDELTVIEGNSEDAVAENIYDINDADIVAFGILPDQGTPEGIETTGGDILYAASDGGVYVSVTAPADALPEEAELSVTLLDENSEDYAEAADAIGLNVKTLDTDEKETGMAVLDICFLLNGREVEPSEPVTVSIDAGAILPDGAENIVIRHLEETDTGVVPVLMAELKADSPVAEFEVESFSPFTVTWTWTEESATGGSPTVETLEVSVTAYLDGTELNDVTSLSFSSADDELDLLTLLSDVGYGTSDYTFSYAIVTAGNTTYGSQDNPVVAIELVVSVGGAGGGGSSHAFQLTYLDGNTVTLNTTTNVSVSAYYTTPIFSVSIETVSEDATEDWLLQATVSHAGEYESIEYVWSVTGTDGSETDLASVEWYDSTGRAFIVWSENAVSFNEVIVQVTATITRANGDTETASAFYYLEYGDEYVNLQMTYGPDQTALGAGVEVTLTNTVTGYTYTVFTDSNGQILNLDIEPGIYTVEATTQIDGSTYSCSATVAMHDGSGNSGNYYINLDYADANRTTGGTEYESKENWNHVDVKLSVGSSSSVDASRGVTINLTGAKITGSDGNAKYIATEESILEGSSDNEWQIYFYDAEAIDEDGNPVEGATSSHQISFATTDTITLIYTLKWDDDETVYTYTVNIDMDSTYASGTTYPATGQRAYKLYNYLYGTSYTSDAQLVAAGVESIDISDMSMMLVAAILCDSSVVDGPGQVSGVTGPDGTDAGMWGMDFAMSIESFVELSANWMFDIEKTYTNHEMEEGMFRFILYDGQLNDDGTTWSIEKNDEGSDHVMDERSNAEAGMDINRNSSDTMERIYIVFDDVKEGEDEDHYYILMEEKGNAEHTTYDSTIIGVIVNVRVDDDETSSTYGEAIVTATYYTLEATGTFADGTVIYTATEYSGEKVTFDGNDYPTIHFLNTYQTGVEIHKENKSGDELAGAQFTLVQTIADPDGDKYYYYDPDSYVEDDPDNSVWVSYNPDEAEPEPFELTSISIGTPWDGIYTLTETAAPDGYNILPAGIVFTVEDGLITSDVSWTDGYDGSNIADYVIVSGGGMTLTIVNETEARLPNTGGIGTWIYTFTGLLLIGGAASLIVYRKRRAVES